MKKDKSSAPISFKILLITIVIATIFIVSSLYFIGNNQKSMRFYSRNTYTYEINKMQNQELDIKSEARLWINGFLNQFTKSLVPKDMRLKKIAIHSIELAETESNTVKISFSANLINSISDYFSDWKPRFVGGRMYCDWMIQFGKMEMKNGKYAIYPIEIKNVIENEDISSKLLNENHENSNFTQYKIEADKLDVTFDGGETYEEVPVALKNLPLTGEAHNVLERGSYQLENKTGAFLFGGATINGVKIPISVVYTTDGGETFITSEVDKIFDVSTYYVNMFSKEDGIIAIGYAKSDNVEYMKIYKTTDAGANWQKISDGPQNKILKGINFVTKEVGFIAYEYDEAFPNNLFVTRDGGQTFTSVVLPDGKLDKEAKDKTWREIYKEATVPILDKNGNLVVYLTQGKDGTYQGGKTVAKYISKDLGIHWTLVEQTQKD